ncbi:MAG: WG repeat-containing protein [Oscillospiraceae bacterium]|nr:WG repeat-containing protein [Oscillospiraceae bacterium]
MKNYKLLAPLVLVVLFLASLYMTFDANGKADEEYHTYLAAARSYAAQGIVVTALEHYAQALGIQESLPLRLEIARIYQGGEDFRSTEKWGQEMLNTYPYSVEAYQYMMELYHEKEDYAACFVLADTMEKRNISRQTVSAILDEIGYTHFFKGNYEEVSAFSEGLCAVRKKETWGYVTETGGSAITSSYLKAGAFRHGLAPVEDRESDSYYIDAEGNKMKVAPGMNRTCTLGVSESGFYTLYNGSTWGLYSDDGELVAGGYEDASSYINGVVAVLEEGRWHLLDNSGEALSNKTYEAIVQDEKGVVCRNDRLFAQEGGYYYLVETNGNKVSETPYEDARLFCDDTYAAVKLDGKWGFIDTGGRMAIPPAYADARSFSGGFAAVMSEDKWGFIDAEGNLVIPYTFEGAKDFNSRGGVFVKRDNEWNLLRLYRFNH